MYQTAFTRARQARGLPGADGTSPHVRYVGEGDAHAASEGEDTALCGVTVTWRHDPPQPWPPTFRRCCRTCELATLTAPASEIPPAPSQRTGSGRSAGSSLFTAKYLVLEFDEEARTVRIYRSRSYSERDPKRAFSDAEAAAEAAAAGERRLRYAVARLAGLRAVPPPVEKPSAGSDLSTTPPSREAEQ